MNTNRRRAVAALTAAGLLWGTTVPLSKLALGWLAPGWLTFVRFVLAAAILLAAAPRARVRAACTPSVLASGAIGYGGSVVVQNAGITRTSVSHAALLIGATPVLVAITAALWHRTVARPVAWAGFAVSLVGVGLVAGGGGGSATAAGDGLVLASLLLSAAFTVAQARRLRGRDPVALTAVQFLGAALAVLPFSVATEGVPDLPAGPGVVLAVLGLAAGGTLLPFTLFAYAQGRVSAEVAGAFLNLEPLAGAVAGVVVFGDPAGPVQLAGGVAILAGIALSGLPLLATGRRGPAPGEERQDTRRPRPHRDLRARRPQPRISRCRMLQPGSPQSRMPRCRILHPRSPQSRILRCRIPLPRNARHWRPPPGQARRAGRPDPHRAHLRRPRPGPESVDGPALTGTPAAGPGPDLAPAAGLREDCFSVSPGVEPGPGRSVREAAGMASEGDARPPAVVGVDGSDQSVAALRWAVQYGAATGTPVRAVLAWHYPTAAGQPPVGHAPEPVTKEVEGHEVTILREAIGKVAPDAPGADVHGEVVYGHPVEVLIEESGHADVLVVGRRGHEGYLAKHIGSVSLHCVNAAQCPVVVVHSHTDG